MGLQKRYDNKFFSPLSFVAVFGSGMGKNQDPGSSTLLLMQVTKAAAAAAARLAKKKPNSHMGFLRQKQDGSTSLGKKNNHKFGESYLVNK